MRFSLKNRGTDPHCNLAFNQRAGYRENLWPRALCKKCYPSQRAIIENTVRVYFWGKERSSLKTSTRLFIRTTRCPYVRLSLSFSFRFIILPLLFLLFPSFLSHYFSFLLSRCKIAIPGRGRDR